MAEKIPSPRLLASPPESFFVFVVGHCEEWPENRDEQGDTAIYNEYLNFGVPAEQCVYIKDSECTKKNCQQTLEKFLKQIALQPTSQQQPLHSEDGDTKKNESHAPRTLIFYYGGHGAAEGFCTIGGTWAYRKVAQTIEELFHGDRVLCLLDCCAAGNLSQHFPSLSSSASSGSAKQYVLLATSQPYITSSSLGDEWIISNTWIQLMRYSCNADEIFDDHLEIEKVISLMADRHIYELGDMFFAYMTTRTLSKIGTDESKKYWSWMPSQCYRQESINKNSSPSLSQAPNWLPTSEQIVSSEKVYRMPERAKISSIYDCRVGDAVVYKHPGGHPLSLTTSESLPFYVPPLWLNATIVAIFENQNIQKDSCNVQLRIRVQYPSQIETWEVELSPRSPNLINHFVTAHNWMVPKSFLETQVMLIQRYRQYLDCSIATKTPVRVVFGQMNPNDDTNDDINEQNLLEGTIMDWKDFDWKYLLRSCTGTSTGTTKYDAYYWNELPIPIKTAAEALGYTKSTWNNDSGIPADTMNLEEFSKIQKDSATVLGYVQPKSVVSSAVGSKGSDVVGLNAEAAYSLKKFSDVSSCSGPHVPVEWNNNQRSSLVPLKQILFREGSEKSPNLNRTKDTMAEIISPSLVELPENGNFGHSLLMQSFIRGLESCGKSIGDAKSILGTVELSAFWVEDETWYDAKPIDIMCYDANVGSNKSLQLFVTHFEYTLSGMYCPIEYEDGVQHLIPLNYIFRRGCQPTLENECDCESDSDSENNSDTEDSASSTSIPTEEAIYDMIVRIKSISQEASSFGKNFSETVEKLDDASKSILASFKSSRKENHSDEEIVERHTNESPSIPTSPSPASNKPYFDYRWSDLPEDIKIVAKRIGYNKKVWDSDGRISIQLVEWGDLTSNEKKDLITIGCSESNWPPAKSYLDESWSDLPRYIKTAAKRIGYNKKSWDADLKIPIEAKAWKDLTPDEIKDLEIIGHNETTWDANESSSSDSKSSLDSNSLDSNSPINDS